MSASGPDLVRLETIKADGRRRRARRYRRNLALAACALVAFTGAGITAIVASQSSTRRAPEAVAGPDTTSPCHNSNRDACGPFRWSPAPGENRPLRARIHLESGPVEAGHAVTVTIPWSDPDAAAPELTLCWGDGSSCPAPPTPCHQAKATGAWSPPRAHAGRDQFIVRHTYRTAGTYPIDVTVVSHAWPEGSCPPPAGDPYSSTTTVHAVVTVR